MSFRPVQRGFKAYPFDIAIDLFQEHILREGPQDNESALEQAKDKQIADAIRKTFGMEKKDHH